MKNFQVSPKASELLMIRYRGIAFFECEDKQQSTEKSVIGRILTKYKILDVDISSSEDFLVCGYEKRGVEMFSLSDFKHVWKIDDFVVERGSTCHLALPIDILKPPRCIVFHPCRNIIFPGQLKHVLNLQGQFESGPIVCEQIPNKFTNRCFSHDNSKMVTNYGIHLTVWNLVENKKIVSLSCRSELLSMLFSANDRFIGTTNIDEVCVYDTENSYTMISRSCAGNFEVLVSTFYSDSWYCFKLISLLVLKSKNEIVKHDLTNTPVPERFIILWPTNARASAKFQVVMESEDRTWFRKAGSGYFFILSNGSALVSSYYRNEIKLLMLTELIQNSKVMKGSDPLLYLRYAKSCSVSVDGTYIYTHDNRGILHIMKLSRPQLVKSKKLGQIKDNLIPFVPVTNGVFFRGEVRKSLWKLFIGKDESFSGIPELWNSEVTQRLVSFPELIGTCYCRSVVQDLVACIMESQ
ncbi:E3 ubiquitin- ligase DZIP3, partial [Paramuricea clavata]